jgi:cell wall-associated NlpC family hydrolase
MTTASTSMSTRMSNRTSTRTSTDSRRRKWGRRVLVSLVAGGGVALTPLPAMASTAPPPASVAPAPGTVAAPTAAAQTAVNTALAQVGKPYVWGGAGPSSFDCSGLMQYAYRAAGISLPHSSGMQSTTGTPVSQAALRPGDLVFFYSPVSHVAMYIGNGQIVQASTAGQPVAVTQLAYMPGYDWARHIA